MSSQIKTLLAGKFITLALCFFLTFVVIIKRQENINASTSSTSEATDSLTICVILMIICQFFEAMILFTGLSVFFDKINVFSIIFQSIGVLFISWFILGQWPSELLWPIWVFGSFLPFILEIAILVLSKKLYSPPIVLEEFHTN